jgi:hypothetical protein
VPQLFSICGRSQHVAAELALSAARGGSDRADAARVHRVEFEMAQEYLWRALIDWPRAVGSNAEANTLATARSALAREDLQSLRAVVERDVLGADAKQWNAQADVSDFESWIARGATAAARFLGAMRQDDPRQGAGDVPLLPRCDSDVASRIVEKLDADSDFERWPTFDGGPAETGAISRLAGQPKAAALVEAFGRSSLVRFAARLLELARMTCGDPPPAPMTGSLPLASGRGLGWVETARGLLLHQIDLDGERIGRYRIVAPTEWNFHPRGALAAAMVGACVASAAGLRRRTEWLLQSLDPCVEYRLDFGHA